MIPLQHGDYPNSERGREMHPRRYFLEQILGCFAECGKAVPVFNVRQAPRCSPAQPSPGRC